jgi:hypothetical protein
MESDTPPARPLGLIRLTPRYPDSPPGTAWQTEAMEADAKRRSKAKASLHRKLDAAKNKRAARS